MFIAGKLIFIDLYSKSSGFNHCHACYPKAKHKRIQPDAITIRTIITTITITGVKVVIGCNKDNKNSQATNRKVNKNNNIE